MQAMADEFTKTAKKIVEPKPQDILNAAKNYFVAKRIMAAENCNGISLNCLGLVQSRRFPARRAWPGSGCNNEGSVGACECDWNAAISHAAVLALLRPAARLHAGPGAEHRQQHLHGRPLHFGHASSAASISRPCR